MMRQYEFFDSRKALMVLLPIWLYWVKVKGLLSAISIWHEFSKSALIQGFVERVELWLVSLWKTRERPFPRGVVA